MHALPGNTYSMLSGVTRRGSRVGVALVSSHPLCRIPHLLYRSSSVPILQSNGTTKWLRPERSLARGGLLMLHQYAYGGSTWPLTEENLRVAIRTAEKFELLIVDQKRALPIAWPTPDAIIFEARNSDCTAGLFNALYSPSVPIRLTSSEPGPIDFPLGASGKSMGSRRQLSIRFQLPGRREGGARGVSRLIA